MGEGLKLLENLYQRTILSTFGHVPVMNVKVDFSTPAWQFGASNPALIAIKITILFSFW